MLHFPLAKMALVAAATVLAFTPTVAQQDDRKPGEPACSVTVSPNVTSGMVGPLAEFHDARRIQKLQDLLKDLPSARKIGQPHFGFYSVTARGQGCHLPEYAWVYHGVVVIRGTMEDFYYRDEKGVEEFLRGLDFGPGERNPGTAGRQPPAQTKQRHEEWLAQRMREAQEIKAGMSRAALLKVFREEGGLQLIPARRYVLRSCEYIKVDVEFAIAANRPVLPDAQLRILTVSKPYLEFPIED